MPETDRIESRNAVETELSLAEAQMRHLQHKIYDLRQRLNETTTIIYNLPVDVMVTIFQDLTQEQHKDRYYHGSLLFDIGSVCRSWRGIACNAPSLWKSLNFRYTGKNSKVQLGLVQEWLLRSGKRPLDISLFLDASNQSNRINLILRVFLLECTRWRSLVVQGTASKQLRYEMAKREHIFPILSSIVFGPCSEEDYDRMLPWTFTTRSLRRLTIQDGAIWGKKHLGLDWSSITEFAQAQRNSVLSFC